MNQVNEYLESFKKPRDIKFWGKIYKNYSDKVSSQKLGDGLQVIYIRPLDTRPQDYIICIDSSIDTSSDDFDYLHIIEALDDEFGRLELDSGVRWGSLENFNQVKEFKND